MPKATSITPPSRLYQLLYLVKVLCSTVLRPLLLVGLAQVSQAILKPVSLTTIIMIYFYRRQRVL